MANLSAELRALASWIARNIYGRAPASVDLDLQVRVTTVGPDESRTVRVRGRDFYKLTAREASRILAGSLGPRGAVDRGRWPGAEPVRFEDYFSEILLDKIGPLPVDTRALDLTRFGGLETTEFRVREGEVLARIGGGSWQTIYGGDF